MYRKRAGGWLKHLDFIVLDALCLQAAFMLAYAVRMGPSSPYSDGEYRGIGLLLLLADMVIVLLSETFSGVLRRGRYEEFTAVLRHACLVEAVVIMYLFTAQKAVHYSRFIIYLTGILYVCAAYFARYLWKALLLRRREAAAEQRSLLIITESGMAEAVLGAQFTIYYKDENFSINVNVGRATTFPVSTAPRTRQYGATPWEY